MKGSYKIIYIYDRFLRTCNEKNYGSSLSFDGEVFWLYISQPKQMLIQIFWKSLQATKLFTLCKLTDAFHECDTILY